MISTYQSSRYALWNHESQFIGDPIEWRTTPKSKQILAIVQPRVLRGKVTVDYTSDLTLRLNEAQQDAIAHWTSELPDHVMPSTAETHGTIAHTGAYTCLDAMYRAGADPPEGGEQVNARVVVSICKIGPLYKAQLAVVDVHRCDVPA